MFQFTSADLHATAEHVPHMQPRRAWLLTETCSERKPSTEPGARLDSVVADKQNLVQEVVADKEN